MPGSASSTVAAAVGIDATTPLMRWNWVCTLPPTWSTAVTGLSSPDAVTMTVSEESADAAGTPVIALAVIAASAAPVAASRRFLPRPNRAR